jgi:hypothetical protein
MAYHVVNLRAFAHPERHRLVKIDRSSVLGNPFPMQSEADREKVIAQYRVWLWEQYNKPASKVREALWKISALHESGDVLLGCWCAPKPCHGDVIIRALQWIETQVNEWERSAA